MTLIKDVVGRTKRLSHDAKAYRLVFQILSAAPRTFPELVKEGLSLRPIHKPNAASSSSNPAIPPVVSTSATGASSSVPIVTPDANAAAANIRARLEAIRSSQEDHRGRIRDERRAQMISGQRLIPEKHPFHSTMHLKKRVLRTLEDHHLIHKRFIPVSSEYPMIHGESRYRWFLTRPEVEARVEEAQSFSIPEQWTRLFEGEPPQRALLTLKDAQAARVAAQRERDLAKHKIKRTEREIWEWEGRDPDMTTPLQKLHLNKRNRRRKAKEEKELVVRRKAKDEARIVAEREVEAKRVQEEREEADRLRKEANRLRKAERMRERKRMNMAEA